MSTDIRFTDEGLAYQQEALWPDGWATEPPPADTADDAPQLRLAWIGRRYRTIADLPDIATYQAA